MNECIFCGDHTHREYWAQAEKQADMSGSPFNFSSIMVAICDRCVPITKDMKIWDMSIWLIKQYHNSAHELVSLLQELRAIPTV